MSGESWAQLPGEQYVVKLQAALPGNYPGVARLIQTGGSAVVLLRQTRTHPLTEAESLVLVKLDPAGGIL